MIKGRVSFNSKNLFGMTCVALVLTLFFVVFSFAASGVTFAAEDETVIKVGWISLPGMQDNDNGVYSGYTYDYLMEVAKYTGWTYEFVPGTLTETMTRLANADVDIVGGIIKTTEREAIYDFPDDGYAQSYISLFTSINSSLDAYDYSAFNGIKVGFLENATANVDEFRSYAEKNGFTYVEMATFADDVALHNAILSGEVDAGVRGAYQSEDDMKILAEFSPTPVYFAVTQGNSEVVIELNRTINQILIDSPYLQIELFRKYFSAKSVVLTDEEKALVNTSVTTPIRVGVVDSSAPLFYSEDGEYNGIAIDVLNLVSEKTGLKFSYQDVNIMRAPDAANPLDTSPQIVVGVTSMDCLTDSRGWYLSDALISDTLAVVCKQGNDITENPSGKTVAVMSGFAMAKSYIAEYMPDYQTAEYPDLEACLTAVEEGEADAAIYIRSCIAYLLQKPYYDNLEIISTYSDSIDLVVAAFVERNEILIDIVNKGLAMLTKDEINAITLNYTLMNPYQLTLNDTLYKFRIPLVIIAILVLVIIAALVVLYVTKRKSTEAIKTAYEQEKLALAAAEQASAAKGSFMSKMSHEIRTPLNAIIGYNTIATNDIAEAKTDSEYRDAVMKVADCLMKSNNASKHLLTIINDVLDMSAIESGRIKIAHDRFDFKGLINSLTTIFYSQAKNKGVELEVRFSTMPEEWFVGDQMRTSQVLTNLLSNAIKFTQYGGKVALSIQQELEEKTAHVHFEVTDTGIGMTQEYLSRIWTPFEQADSSISRRFGGTGLGLSITKNLIELMGGNIEVESELGKGSKFSVDISFERTEQPANAGTYDFSEINALVVDDDQSTCDYIQLLMERFGAHCTAVTSGMAAIDAMNIATSQGEPYSLGLVDWRMPQMDGLETVRRLREIAGDDMPIIVITAYDFSEIVDKAAEVGITKFISKPLFQSSLFNILTNVCDVKCEKAPEIEKTVSFVGERVLLVEDNSMNMEIASRIMETSGLTVDSAWNGKEALDIFLASAPGTYKAILMDVQMPVMDGHQATKAIRASKHEEAKSIPIIAMTADAFAENVAEALASGMNDHIAKPIDVNRLFECLSGYIKKKED